MNENGVYEAAADTVVVFFTYKEDAQSLWQAIRFVRKSMPRAAIAVFDDGSNPLDVRVSSALVVDLYQVTEFNRWKNLNGRECVMGELICFQRAMRLTGKNIVVKCDSDTAILDGTFVNFKGDMMGHSWGGSFCFGPCYVLRGKDLIDRMLWEITHFRGLRVEEDAAMTQLCRASGGKVLLADRLWSQSFMGFYDYNKELSPDNYKRFKVLTFGCRDSLPQDCNLLKRVGLAMRLYYQNLYDVETTPIIESILDDGMIAWADQSLHRETTPKVEIVFSGKCDASVADSSQSGGGYSISYNGSQENC